MMLVGFMVVEDSWWAAGTVHHWDSCNASTCMIPRSSVSGQRPVLGLITPGSEYDLLPRSFLLGIWFTYYYYYYYYVCQCDFAVMQRGKVGRPMVTPHLLQTGPQKWRTNVKTYNGIGEARGLLFLASPIPRNNFIIYKVFNLNTLTKFASLLITVFCIFRMILCLTFLSTIIFFILSLRC